MCRAAVPAVLLALGALTAARAGEAVLVRGRVHAVRGKGKSAFLVLREKGCTVQVGRRRPPAPRQNADEEEEGPGGARAPLE